jgi:hypothetical protein
MSEILLSVGRLELQSWAKLLVSESRFMIMTSGLVPSLGSPYDSVLGLVTKRP